MYKILDCPPIPLNPFFVCGKVLVKSEDDDVLFDSFLGIFSLFDSFSGYLFRGGSGLLRFVDDTLLVVLTSLKPNLKKNNERNEYHIQTM